MTGDDILKWRQVIKEHYLSLDGFDDATTIRNMLKRCNEALAEWKQLIEAYLTLEEDLSEADKVQLTRIHTIKIELEFWLYQRDLTP